MSKARMEEKQKPIELDHITARAVYRALIFSCESDFVFLKVMIEEKATNEQTAKNIQTELYHVKKSIGLIKQIEETFLEALKTDLGESLVRHRQEIFSAYAKLLEDAGVQF